MTRVRSMLTAGAVLTIGAVSTTAAAQSAPACENVVPPAAPLRWYPASPRAGALFHVVLTTNAEGTRPEVRVSGEPLHFHAEGDSLVALAAVPVDSTQGVTLAWRCGETTPSRLRVPTQAGDYELEELKVAPRFGAAPSAAVAERQQRESRQALAVSEGAHRTPRLWSTPFTVPRSSRITSPFGGGRVFNGAVSSRHMGTDFAGAIGAPVRAVNRGVVRLKGAFYLGGNVLYIDHGDGLVTAYLHLSKQLVAVGDTVSQGQVIGHVGNTGRVTGPHLHLIARFGQITIDPASLFERP